jgi:hypothetical protein
MRYRNDITAERLREVLYYDLKTGIFTWRVSPVGWIKVGDPAGSITKKGYIRICVDGAMYMAHRLAVLYVTGAWPVDQVDHWDMIKSNNAWLNLRQADNGGNQFNTTLRRDNKSGHKNVSWHPTYNEWIVSFSFDGKRKHPFKSEDLELAAFVASEWRDKLHGKFARTA